MSEKIEKILKTYVGDDTDLCYYIFNVLKKEEKARGLQCFMEKVKARKSNSTFTLEKQYSIQELKKLDSIYTKYINELLATIINKAHLDKWKAEKFYAVLWEKINTDILFENDKIKAFALFKFAQNPLMPFIEIEDPLSMSDEEFSNIVERTQDSIVKIRHILALNFEQKTEVSSLILKEIQKDDSFEDQSVLWAIALEEFTQGKLNVLMQMLSNVKVEHK